jgi:PAS domain-containing protein
MTELLASYEAALNQSALGILILSGDGELRFANRAADRLLEAGDYLRRRGTGVSARDLGDAVRLQVAVDHVCGGGREQEDPVIALKRRHPLRPLLICISPSGDTGAALRIFDPDGDTTPFLEPVCSHYRLSPSKRDWRSRLHRVRRWKARPVRSGSSRRRRAPI